MSPAPSRSTRVRCSASSFGSVTISSPGSSAGAKNRCTVADYRTRADTEAVYPLAAQSRQWRNCTRRAILAALAMFFRGQIIGKYKILSTIGSGGFGTVYLAEDTWIDKKVALKVPHKQGVDFGELLREPRLLATLNHPNIVTILTAEKQENVFFIVMEFVPARRSNRSSRATGRSTCPVALDYTCQICNAVDHAHRHGVLHRDLRPSNVIVSDSGLVKVADFGTSRFLEIAAHGTTVIGSPPYMAPEQFHGKAVFASDLYSLGVTMFQMLTGDAAVRDALARRSRSAHARRAARGAAPQESEGPEGDQRHRPEGDGARHPRPLPAGRRVCWTMCSRPRAGAADARRAVPARPPSDDVQDIQTRLKARETPQPRFCWHCRKPLHARSDRCPFCGETQ